MKKFFASMLILICALLSAVTFTACSDAPCKHKKFEWQQATPYCAHVCTKCGYVGETASHNFSDGKCTLCGIDYETYLDNFNGNYGYNYLGTMKNGENLQKLYSEISDRVRSLHLSGSISDGGRFYELDFSVYNLNKDEAVKVYKTFLDDNPLYYWLSNSLTYTEDTLYLEADAKFTDGRIRSVCNNSLYEKAAKWSKAVCNEGSAYARAFAFHDLIIEAVDYAQDEYGNPQSEKWAHGVYGVFEENSAVCEGYAKAFQLLLNICGVENVYVTGEGGNDFHAWNLVKLDDGGWYWYDLTFDDTPDAYWGMTHDYCASIDWSFLENHKPGDPDSFGADFLYGLPKRSSTAYDGEGITLKDKFTADCFEYVIIGYNDVSVCGINTTGAVEIPSSVTYEGREYKVRAIGGYNRYGDFSYIGDIEVASTIEKPDVTSVFIPATVKYMAYSSFCAWGSLKEIAVDEDNTKYSSIDGVLFTKSHDVLLAYPSAREASAYLIPYQTTMIGFHAFSKAYNKEYKLETLVIHSAVKNVGVVDWGTGFSGIVNVITGEWTTIIHSLAGRKELIIDENNPYFKYKDGLVYNGDYTSVYD